MLVDSDFFTSLPTLVLSLIIAALTFVNAYLLLENLFSYKAEWLRKMVAFRLT
jgi:hypothetical protein